jgi:curved DNA-binding protein CbpA
VILRRAPIVTTLKAMLTAIDAYHVLQVSPDAEPEVIQAAYRALARKHHPDVGGSQVQMAMLNAAWETLRDQDERARYDLERRTASAEPPTRAEGSAYQRPVAPAPFSHPLSGRSRSRSGTVLDYGRYAGLSLGEIAAQDRNYLEWLVRTPLGRRFQAEIEALLTVSRPAVHRPSASGTAPRSRSRFSRRR